MGLMVQGFVLMIVGMLVVFGFLVLMVLTMHAAAAFFMRREARAEIEISETAPSDDMAEIAVVLAAIQAHSTK